jgi:phosphinothricin acetyltransferase
VLNGLASFEEVPPDLAETRRRYAAVRSAGCPYLVAPLAGGGIAGYGYASSYRGRPAYRYTVEDSLYVAPDQAGRGLGRTLLGALIAECTALGYRQMVAVVGDSANAPSIHLHEALGFRRVGTLQAVGYKFGRWVDSVILQRPLGGGATAPPA